MEVNLVLNTQLKNWIFENKGDKSVAAFICYTLNQNVTKQNTEHTRNENIRDSIRPD